LAIHGPNHGVGGGPDSVVDGLLASVSLLTGMKLPGVWILFTRMDPELPADVVTGAPDPASVACALALALLPAGSQGTVQLEITSGPCPAAEQPLTLSLLDHLLRQTNQASTVAHSLGASGKLTLHTPFTLAGPHFALLSAERSLTNR
jgi:hypothetical protein